MQQQKSLTANGECERESKADSITNGDPVLELTFCGNNYKFHGPTSFTTGRIVLHFYNQSSSVAMAFLVKREDCYFHQDMIDTFVDGYSEAHYPGWTTEIGGVWKEIIIHGRSIWNISD